MISFKYKQPETDSGSLRTPATFYEFTPDNGPEPGQNKKNTLHECFAEIYNPSMKDMEIMKATGTKEAITLRIRDAGKEYVPTNKHFFEVSDYRYTGKVFNIISVAPDIQNNKFIKVIGGYSS